MKQFTKLNQKHAGFTYFPRYFEESELEAALANITWTQNRITVYGKTHFEPRLTAWFGPAYRYGSVHWAATPMPSDLETLTARLTHDFQFEFNAVLLNRYRNGNDSMGWHRDNEPEIDQRLIASVSWGAPRSFFIRSRDKTEKHCIELQSGSLLLMHHMQNDYEHAIPKRLRVQNERINLTFRRVNR
jgi:alkylated DNA repair dioxygenase AlkB